MPDPTLSYPFPEPGDLRACEFPGAAQALAARAGQPHVQGAQCHWRREKQELLIELWRYPTSTEEQLKSTLRLVEMAVYSWQHLPKGWTVRAVVSKRKMPDPWSGQQQPRTSPATRG